VVAGLAAPLAVAVALADQAAPRSSARDGSKRSSCEDHLFEMFGVSGAIIPEEANIYLISTALGSKW
jgi:hypothetical protein